MPDKNLESTKNVNNKRCRELAKYIHKWLRHQHFGDKPLLRDYYNCEFHNENERFEEQMARQISNFFAKNNAEQ